MKPILITSYVNPDLDGYASAAAYSEFLKSRGVDVVVGIMGEPHDEVKYVLDRFGLEKADLIDSDRSFDEVILVDASDTIGLEGKINPDKVIEIIDHRKINEADKFKIAKAQIELVGAAATLISEKFKQEGVKISQRSAILLYSAIISNTLNFKGGVTTDRDRSNAEWLAGFFELPSDYWKDLFLAKSDLSGDKLASRIKGDLARFFFGQKKLGIAQLEIIGAEDLLKTRGEEIVSILNDMKENYKLDHIFQNIIELDPGKNYFITDDEQFKNILEKILNVKFIGNIAKRSELIMRKQIVPLIKDELEK